VFEPLYYADRLSVVNPCGDVGIVTLWSTEEAARRVLNRVSPDVLDPVTSRVAVISNLYGDGMHQMFCNLLHNPQIRHLVAIGEEMNLPTVGELDAFFERGVEETSLLGRPVLRISGTDRILPVLPGLDVDRLRARLSFRYLGRLGELSEGFGVYLDSLTRFPDDGAQRVRVEIPPPDASSLRHSDIGSHQVRRRRPLDAWKELVTRTVRFGHPVPAGDGSRLELLNTRVVIAEPGDDDAGDLAEHGFDIAAFRRYQDAMLDAGLPGGVTYTYGNRLRGNRDALAGAAELLVADPQTRRAYVSLWDNSADLTAAAAPCLVAVFFRRSEGRLTVTATYRAHNLLTAWLQNVYGLMAVQRFVCEATGTGPGPLTVISHQLGIDPRSPRYEIGVAVAAAWTRDEDRDASGRHELRQDPNGYFVVTVDLQTREIVADHRIGGLAIKQYRGRRAATIARDIAADMAISLVSHALWVGQELQAKEALLAR
jgi:hypothetical protein